MAEFKIKGQPKVIGMREFRALLRAADCVLRMMGLHPKEELVDINMNDSSRSRGEIIVRVVSKKSLEAKIAGTANRMFGVIKIREDLDFSETTAVIIHELFHCYSGEEHWDNEWITSTMAARIKADVIQVANLLTEASQKYAAYKAHQKIAYRKGDPDEYNDEQHHEKHEESVGERFRRHRRKRA